MRIMHLTIVVILVASLFSCQKELNELGTPGSPNGQDKLLSKVTVLSPGSYYLDSFVYDNLDRVVAIFQISVDSQFNFDRHVYFYDLYYQGNEMHPYKITDTSRGREMEWFIQYNAQNQKVADSIVYYKFDGKQINHFSYSSNRISTYKVSLVNGVVTQTVRDTFDFVTGNCKRYASFSHQVASNYQYHGEFAMTFDDKPNPFSKLNIATSAFLASDFFIFGGYFALSKNNIITSTFTNNLGQMVNTDFFQYVYDSDGNPMTTFSHSPTDPGNDVSLKFEYRK